MKLKGFVNIKNVSKAVHMSNVYVLDVVSKLIMSMQCLLHFHYEFRSFCQLSGLNNPKLANQVKKKKNEINKRISIQETAQNGLCCSSARYHPHLNSFPPLHNDIINHIYNHEIANVLCK